MKFPHRSIIRAASLALEFGIVTVNRIAFCAERFKPLLLMEKPPCIMADAWNLDDAIGCRVNDVIL